MTKKILILLMAVTLCFSLFACAKQPSPTDVVNTYLAALQTEDTETIAKVYSGDVSDAAFNTSKDATIAFSEELEAQLKTKFLKFQYSTSEASIKKDKATVNVSVKTYNFGDTFKETVSEYFKGAFSMIFSNMSEKEMAANLEKTLGEKLDSATFTFESSAPLTLTKTEEGWIIDEIKDDSQFLNILTGGMLDFTKDLEDSFKSITEK